MNSEKRVLLVNPWIYDFSAFDLWAVPMGLLYIGSFLKENGVEVYLLDLTDPFYSLNYGMGEVYPKRKSGKGHYPKQVVEKPSILSFFPRRFKRYGIPPEDVEKILRKIPAPHLIIMTSRMTYWYIGVRETVSFLRRFYPETKIILGGIYASLLPDHALNNSGADVVMEGPFEKHIKTFEEFLDIKFSKFLPSLPCMELYIFKDFVPVLLSRGCPFRCSYCASYILYSEYSEYDSEIIIDYIIFHSERLNTPHIVFYDDALLYRKERKVYPVLRGLIKSGRKFQIHFPNALHARFVDEETAELIKESGGKSIFLGLEFYDERLQRDTGGKVNRDDFERAIRNLHRAGFTQKEIGVYIMAGYPFQDWREVKRSIDYVIDTGGLPKLAEYSPVPHTLDWEKAVKASPFPIESEPLFHNNTIIPCRWEKFTFEDFLFLKSYLREKVAKINS